MKEKVIEKIDGLINEVALYPEEISALETAKKCTTAVYDVLDVIKEKSFPGVSGTDYIESMTILETICKHLYERD